MQIGKILFPITSLGPGMRLGIWVQGCLRFCKGCSNPELQIFDKTTDISVQAIYDSTMTLKFNGITISGGEPFIQEHELKELVELYIKAGFDDILIYTGYTIEELKNRRNSDIDYILSHISVLIDGPFVESLVDDVPLRGSSNQRVIILNQKYEEAYKKILKQEKKVDIFQFENETHFIGIPFKNYDEIYKKYVKRGEKDE